jgi:hypothetical protein
MNYKKTELVVSGMRDIKRPRSSQVFTDPHGARKSSNAEVKLSFTSEYLFIEVKLFFTSEYLLIEVKLFLMSEYLLTVVLYI